MLGIPQVGGSPSLGGWAPGGGGAGLPLALPWGGALSQIRPMPGPAALGPTSRQGSMGAGGVAGVGINPVSLVPLPAVAGGPHPLPILPQLPLPEGFPNPFALTGIGPPPGAGGGAEPFAPGTTTVVGPQGELPGLGWVGPPPELMQNPTEYLAQLASQVMPQGGEAGAAAPQPPAAGSFDSRGPSAFNPSLGSLAPLASGPVPSFATPGPSIGPAAGMAMGPSSSPAAGLAMGPSSSPAAGMAFGSSSSPAPGLAPGQAVRNTAGGQSPLPAGFWLSLAWQLLSARPVQEQIGELRGLMEGPDRMRVIELATNLLLGPELQGAFRALASGSLRQMPFTQLFAERLKGELGRAALAR